MLQKLIIAVNRSFVFSIEEDLRAIRSLPTSHEVDE